MRSMYSPDDRDTRDHQWIKLQGSIAAIGIMDYAQRQLEGVALWSCPR